LIVLILNNRSIGHNKRQPLPIFNISFFIRKSAENEVKKLLTEMKTEKLLLSFEEFGLSQGKTEYLNCDKTYIFSSVRTNEQDKEGKDVLLERLKRELCNQFHQHLTSSFCPNFVAQKIQCQTVIRRHNNIT
jgi:hypothetical protein